MDILLDTFVYSIMNKKTITHKIKSFILDQGFDACGICKAEAVDEKNRLVYNEWLANDYHADMGYMERNADKRLDPTLLVEGAKTIIVMALNYYPKEFQQENNPQFAYYAYGKDYHEVVKEKLKTVYEHCRSLDSSIEGRYFCDTAPLFERYWAAKAGLGWIGKNSLLIIPKRGTYFFLSALVLNIELEYDDATSKKMPSCVTCTRCIDACPTGAIVSPQVIDAQRCLSYQTIENKGDIDEVIATKMGNRVYGCDICQQVCPWNRFAVAHSTPEFDPSSDFLSLTEEAIANMSVEEYQKIFKGSAIKRAKLSGLKRNIEALRENKK